MSILLVMGNDKEMGILKAQVRVAPLKLFRVGNIEYAYSFLKSRRYPNFPMANFVVIDSDVVSRMEDLIDLSKAVKERYDFVKIIFTGAGTSLCSLPEDHKFDMVIGDPASAENILEAITQLSKPVAV